MIDHPAVESNRPVQPAPAEQAQSIDPDDQVSKQRLRSSRLNG